MRAAGADLVVALAHGGIDMLTEYSPAMENGAGYLSQVAGIDALITGHQHLLFPDTNAKSQFAGQPGINLEKGLINGVPAVQAGQWGNNLGQITLKLAYDKGWQVQKDATRVQRISTRLTAQNGATPATYVEPDAAVQQLVQAEHASTISYVKTPIGQSRFDMATYYALAGDVSALQIVNMAQIDYLTDYIAKNKPSYAALPILSAAAPFKGGRNGPGDFTYVKQGNIAINNAADLYLYPNTLQVVRVSGDIVRQWLEKTAEQFRQIDPGQVAPQDLIDTGFPTFNFDVLYAAGNALRYEIDVTHPKGSRITKLTYQGAPLDPAAQFLVVTNNYRASGGGDFPGLAGGKGDIVLQAPDASRDVLISYIRKHPDLDLATYGLDRSWRFARVGALAGPVVFSSVPGTLAMAAAHGVDNVTVHDATPDSVTQLSRYAVDLSR
jgi:2',3'-cyclic-nucleotide 2'-phosphodiesterase/3'-nucleotidase